MTMEETMMDVETTSDGLRSACWFCGGTWGKCACSWPDSVDTDGFDFEGFFISQPNITECNRFFVDPVLYYGDAFVRWWARHPKNPSPCDADCEGRYLCRHDLWRAHDQAVEEKLPNVMTRLHYVDMMNWHRDVFAEFLYSLTPEDGLGTFYRDSKGTLWNLSFDDALRRIWCRYDDDDGTWCEDQDGPTETV